MEKVRIEREVTRIVRFYPPHRSYAYTEMYPDDDLPPPPHPVPVPVPRRAAWSYDQPGPEYDAPAYNYNERPRRDYVPSYDHPWWEEPGVRR